MIYNMFMQMSVILVLLNVWSGHSMMPWCLLLPGNVVVSQSGVCMVFYYTIPMVTSLGMYVCGKLVVALIYDPVYIAPHHHLVVRVVRLALW